ncbi:MAG TPA: Ig-like domain-containing protein [Streptosporangiaceae bacterium]|nr:Ig-like domain-containing protein [Streptosporangiaceae bacterium]
MAAIGCILGLVTTACSGGSPFAGHTATQVLSFVPANGTKNVNTGRGITVRATQGKLSSVTVTTAGEPVSGTLNAARTAWHSTNPALDVSQRYTVTAKAADASGNTVTRTSAFRTMTPSQTFTTKIHEVAGQTYGVGMPIILYFSRHITDKAAVERALQVRTSTPVVGSWYWDDSCGLAPTCVYFRPQSYWPAHTRVSFTGHLNGVEGAPGVYGDHTLTQSFTIGDSLIVTASTVTHHMDVYRNGKLYAQWPISTGRSGDDTANGTYLTIEKSNPVVMTGPGYSLSVPWSVRFTWSGSYLHDAYWSVGVQGFANVSHGCVNMPPADAQIYYKMENPGDPVTITGSPRAGVWDNGWTMWFLPWRRYLQGSALGQAVEAGPGGSTFVSPWWTLVSPSWVSAVAATAPLGAPNPGNSAASQTS